MQNLRKTLNQITANTTPITIHKINSDTKVRLNIAEPYATLGFSPDDWTNIHSTILLNWAQEERILQQRLNQTLIDKIIPRYSNTIHRYLHLDAIPSIILSILCQNISDYSINVLNFDGCELPDIPDYLEQITTASLEKPRCLSAVSTYVIDSLSDIFVTNIENGVNMIIWDNQTIRNRTISQIYGASHIWDHFSFNHIHEITTYEGHAILLQNAIKRTWLATLSLTSGTKQSYTRINYGYMVKDITSKYNLDQYRRLALLNYGTVITPPYDYARTLQLTLNEIESIVMKTLAYKCIKPTLNTVYITSLQLGNEILLGNNPIPNRFTIVSPETFVDKLPLYDQYTAVQLPNGKNFDVDVLLKKIEVQRNIGYPEYQLRLPQINHCILANDFIATEHTTLDLDRYEVYLDLLRIGANKQFQTSNIVSSVSSDGISISLSNIAERAVAAVSLNDNVFGIDLNEPDSIPNAILTLTTKPYIYDYHLSANLLKDVIAFTEITESNYSNMVVVVVNPKTYPATFANICECSRIAYDIYSTDGSVGTQLSSLYTFGTLSANMVFMSITEKQYLEDTYSYNLFLSSISTGVYYSIEFYDFEVESLHVAILSIIDVLILAQQVSRVKVQFGPPILNDMKVGLRIVFSLVDLPYIQTSYETITQRMLTPYARHISTDIIVIDPIKSLSYDSRIIPRMGTQLLARCQIDDFEDTLGYVSSLCRYTTSKCYSKLYTYYEISGIIDQSRIVIMDRLQMFRKNVTIKPEQLLPNDFISKADSRVARLSQFELITQTDRLLLYIYRRDRGLLKNDISDYGSAHFLNFCMTDKHYTMYDIDDIDVGEIPDVTYIQNLLEWGNALPYIEGDDVLIYNSLFMNSNVTDENMAIPIIEMLRPLLSSKNIYFNLPYMSDQLAEILLPLNIITRKNNRYYIKLGEYPAVPCLKTLELVQILQLFPLPKYKITDRSPTLLDYYFTSRMIQRSANTQVYHNAIMIHQCLPFFEITS